MSTLSQFVGGNCENLYFYPMTFNQTWVAPKDMTLMAIVIGGGGSGGSTIAGGGGGTNRRATGGGAGGFCKKTFSVSAGDSFTANVGSGGIAFSTTTEKNGMKPKSVFN